LTCDFTAHCADRDENDLHATSFSMISPQASP
jgi:hypothetical protein